MNINRLIKMRRELENVVLKEIERRARRILTKHPDLGEFIMGMGTAFFSYRNGSIYAGTVSCDDRKYMRPVAALLLEFQDLRITGHPMRFTATGKKVTDW